jgi:hypothetical protein
MKRVSRMVTQSYKWLVYIMHVNFGNKILITYLNFGNMFFSLSHVNTMFATRNEQEPEAPARNWRNWTVRFGKPNGPVLSGPTTVKGPTGLRRCAPPSAKWYLDGGEAWTMTTLEVVAVNSRSNWRKMKKIEKLGQKYEKYKFDWLCWRCFTIGHVLYLYRQQDVALWVRYDQIFPKQTKSQTLLGLYLF